MVCLLSRGHVLPVVRYIRGCWDSGDTDVSLIRYFVAEVLDMIAPPYSPEFVQLLLPLVETPQITDSMRGGGDDLVTQFVVHCKGQATES